MPKGIRKKVTPVATTPESEEKFTLSAGEPQPVATRGRQKGWRKVNGQPSKKAMIVAIFESGIEKTAEVMAELKKQKVADVSESYINTMKSNWRKSKAAGTSQPAPKTALAKVEPAPKAAKAEVATESLDDLQLALFAARNGGFASVISRLSQLSGN